MQASGVFCGYFTLTTTQNNTNSTQLDSSKTDGTAMITLHVVQKIPTNATISKDSEMIYYDVV